VSYAVGFFIPVLVILLAIPLVLGKVPPNDAYGFRTPKTRSSPEIWYPANRAAGGFMIAAGVVALALNLALFFLVKPAWDERTLHLSAAGFSVGPLLLSLIPSFLYLKRLK
jgi:hypothetical protein